MAADWLNRPRPPRRAGSGAIDAFRDTAGLVFTIPSDAGPITRIPLARACRTSSRCRASPRSPSSAYPAVATTMPLTPAAAQSVHHLGDFVVGHGDDGELDRAGHLGQPGEGEHAGEFQGFRVDGVDGPGEAAFDDVFEQLVAHRPPFAAGPDHGHGRRRQQVLDAARLGAVFAGLHHGPGFFRGVDVEFQADDAVVEMPFDVVAGVGRRPSASSGSPAALRR